MKIALGIIVLILICISNIDTCYSQKIINSDSLIINRWINVRDFNDKIMISAQSWIYNGESYDSSIYFIFGKKRDSIEVINTDTLIYHIENIDEYNLTLNYLGRKGNLDWITLLSYRKDIKAAKSKNHR